MAQIARTAYGLSKRPEAHFFKGTYKSERCSSNTFLIVLSIEGRLRPNNRLCLKRHLCLWTILSKDPRSSPYLMDTYCLHWISIGFILVKRKHQEVRREKLIVYIRILSSNILALTSWYLIVPTKYCQIMQKKNFFILEYFCIFLVPKVLTWSKNATFCILHF